MIPLADPLYAKACIELHREKGGGWLRQDEIHTRMQQIKMRAPPLPPLPRLPLPPLPPLPRLPLPPLPLPLPPLPVIA